VPRSARRYLPHYGPDLLPFALFDDWFFSSIAPEPDGFGSSSGSTLTENFTGFLTGSDPLTNRAYLPIHEDQVTSSAKASTIYTAEVAPADSWKTIASRLEVEGMFNVNSTSDKLQTHPTFLLRNGSRFTNLNARQIEEFAKLLPLLYRSVKPSVTHAPELDGRSLQTSFAGR